MKVKIEFFTAGYCTHPEAIVIRGGKWQQANFPSLFAAIEHPELGIILYDTGYSSRFFTETQTWPLRLYSLITPVYFQNSDRADLQLQRAGIEPADVKYIIISHFHADHIGGLQDFPHARFICFKSAYAAVKNRHGWSALTAGFLPGLLPVDFESRSLFVEDKLAATLPDRYAPFTQGFDLFGDRSLLAVELPGHAIGQLGLLLETDERSYFLIADACWLGRAYREFIQPHPIAYSIFANDREYIDTLSKIHQLHKRSPELKIVPTHCERTWSELNGEN